MMLFASVHSKKNKKNGTVIDLENQPSREDIMQFEQSRNQLMSVSAQKQQFRAQSITLEKALEELGKTTEKKVYKAVGNILILSDTQEAKKELQETKETLDLRIKTLQKQEDVLVQKLNKLRHQIEGTSETEEANSGEKTVLSKKEKTSEKKRG
jgi:prefoldin beta subunit